MYLLRKNVKLQYVSCLPLFFHASHIVQGCIQTLKKPQYTSGLSKECILLFLEALKIFFFCRIIKFFFPDKTMRWFFFFCIKLHLFNVKNWTSFWVYILPTFLCCDKISFYEMIIILLEWNSKTWRNTMRTYPMTAVLWGKILLIIARVCLQKMCPSSLLS